MVVYNETMKNMKKLTNIVLLFSSLDFAIDPGRSRTDSGAEKHQKHLNFQHVGKMQKGVADCRLRLESRKIADYN